MRDDIISYTSVAFLGGRNWLPGLKDAPLFFLASLFLGVIYLLSPLGSWRMAIGLQLNLLVTHLSVWEKDEGGEASHPVQCASCFYLMLLCHDCSVILGLTSFVCFWMNLGLSLPWLEAYSCWWRQPVCALCSCELPELFQPQLQKKSNLQDCTCMNPALPAPPGTLQLQWGNSSGLQLVCVPHLWAITGLE